MVYWLKKEKFEIYLMLLVMASFLKQYKTLTENSLKQVVSRKAQKSRVQKNCKKT